MPSVTIKTLRDKRRSRPIVVIRIVDLVVVELDLVVIELEVRGVIEVTIGLGYFAFIHPYHEPLPAD